MKHKLNNPKTPRFLGIYPKPLGLFYLKKLVSIVV
jgi:hypothetical protein